MAEGQIETTFQAAVDAGKIHGAIVCATNAAGRFYYQSTIGERTLLSGEKKPHQLDDVVFLASATKLLASVAVMACVEDGQLTLDGDLSTIAPELAAKHVLTGFTTDSESGTDKPILEPQKHGITLRMLLTHSSGLSYYFTDPQIMKWRDAFSAAKKRTDAGEQLPVEEMFDTPLSFQPGTGWAYGVGLDWAGRIVERATGKTLGAFLQSRVFDRLGVTDFSFYPVTRENLRSRLVDLNPNDPEAQGRAVGTGDIHKIGTGDFGGHGGFITTPDYLKVLQALLRNDGKILQPSTVDHMFESSLSAEAAAGQQASNAGPMGHLFLNGVDPKTKVGYGLGGLVTLEGVDGWYGEHTLTWGGGSTFAWFVDRKNDLCGVGALQASIPTDGAAMAPLKQTFRKDIYAKYQAWKKESGH